MKNQVQLCTYIDRLSSGGIADLATLLNGPLQGVFGGLHLLPFYTPIDGADAGFDPSDHTQVDARLGNWQDLKKLAASFDVMADVIVNHISSASPQYLDFVENADKSAFSGMFLNYETVFPHGATQAELLAIYRPRPGLPFQVVTLKTGKREVLWSTFTPQQIDIDVSHSKSRAYLEEILATLSDNGVNIVRLDAVGYAIKKAGTNCFMLPETIAFAREFAASARARKLQVLLEIHSHYLMQIEIAKQVDWVYDFALPPLVLHALSFGNAQYLKHWISIRPHNAITVLDTHDGIGVIDIGADERTGALGLVPPQQLSNLVDRIHANSGGSSKRATGEAASNLDLYQVNCTYYDALGRNDAAYLIARAIQFFVPGVPQVYYVGLLAGHNDVALLELSKVGRDINRQYFTPDTLSAALQKSVVQKLLELIKFRNTHLAFSGAMTLLESDDTTLKMRWENNAHFALLEVDLSALTHTIQHSNF